MLSNYCDAYQNLYYKNKTWLYAGHQTSIPPTRSLYTNYLSSFIYVKMSNIHDFNDQLIYYRNCTEIYHINAGKKFTVQLIIRYYYCCSCCNKCHLGVKLCTISIIKAIVDVLRVPAAYMSRI